MIRYIYIFIYIYISYHPIYTAKCSGADEMIIINRIDKVDEGCWLLVKCSCIVLYDFGEYYCRMELDIIWSYTYTNQQYWRLDYR